MTEEQKHKLIKRGLLILAGFVVFALAIRAILPQRVTSQAVGPETSEQRAELARQKEEAALAEAALQSVKQEADRILRAIGELDGQIDAWRTGVEPLLSNKTGKFLAAKPDYVRAFSRLLEQELATDEDVAAYRAQVDPILRNVQSALEGSAHMERPGEGTYERLSSVRKQVDKALAIYRDARKTVDGMLAVAKRGAPADITLSEAMDRVDEDYIAERVRKLAAEREESERKTTQDLLEIQRRKDAEIREAKKAQAEMRLDNERKDIEAETLREATAAERQRLMALADDEAIQALYSPFLSRGAWHTGTAEPGPVSYRFLVGEGALDSFDAFRLWATHGENDRKSWPNPSGVEDPLWKEYRKRWEIFRDLAPIWAERGKLNP